MKIYLDGQPVAVVQDAGIADVFQQIQVQVDRQGRMIQQIAVNDKPLDGQRDDIHRVLASPNVQRVSITTAPVQALLRDLIEQTIPALPALVDSIEHVAISLRQGKDEEAFSALGSAVDGLQAYLQLLTFLGNQTLPFASAAQQHAVTLGHWLQQVMTVWQREDVVLMADLLLHQVAVETADDREWLAELIEYL